MTDRLLRELAHPEAEVRAQAADRLQEMGASAAGAVPALLTSLNDDSPVVRVRAIWALGHIGVSDERVVVSLLGLLKDRDQDALHRGAAATALRLLGKAEVLSQCLESRDVFLRKKAAAELNALGVGAQAEIPRLIQGLADKSEDVRASCCEALGKLSLAKKQLEAALRHSKAFIRIGVSESLLRLESWHPSRRENPFFIAKKPGKVSPVARRAMSQLIDGCTSKDPAVRLQSIYTMANLGVTGRPGLDAALRLSSDRNVHIRRAALSALGAFDVCSPQVCKHLSKSVRDKDRLVRDSAIQLIGRMKERGSSAVPALLAVLKAETRDVDLHALVADVLGAFGPAAKTALPTLRRIASESKRSDYKRTISRAIARIEAKG